MRRRIGPGLVFLFLICAHARGLLYAQAPEDPRSLLDAYAAIAERYREGSAAAVRELQALGPLRLKR